MKLKFCASILFSAFFVCLIPNTPLQVTDAQAASWRVMKQSWPKLWFNSSPCTVYRVIDGDTVHVYCNGRKEKLRLVGIDTPETKHPFKPVEYFGPEASAKAKQLMPQGSKVWLAFKGRPGSRGQRGRYGRLLAYLFLPNQKMFNALMIRQGYAMAMRRYPHTYMKRFIRIEDKAKLKRRGMWAKPARVKHMMAEDRRYRQHKKNCRRKLGIRGRFNFVLGDSSKKYYFTRRHRSYFRTNPYKRVLFCSVSEATSRGYSPAPRTYRSSYWKKYAYKRRSYRRRNYRRRSSPSNSGGNSRVLVIGDPKTKTFRIMHLSEYTIFSSKQAAIDAGYRYAKGRRTYRKRKRRRRSSAPPASIPNCGGSKPLVGNKRSKIYRTPDQRSYRRAKKRKNAVFFCTEREAKQAGYRKAKR